MKFHEVYDGRLDVEVHDGSLDVEVDVFMSMSMSMSSCLHVHVFLSSCSYPCSCLPVFLSMSMSLFQVEKVALVPSAIRLFNHGIHGIIRSHRDLDRRCQEQTSLL